MADSSDHSSGSPQRVAHDLYAYLRGGLSNDGKIADVAKRHLDLYAECYKATRSLNHDTSKLV